MPSLQKTTKNNDIFRGFLYYWSYFFALLSPYMKGFINYVRISEKTIKLIDIANRIDEKIEGNDAKEILRVIGDYSKALDLLDDYDHRTLGFRSSF